jgi:hypothetical protein
LSLNTDLGLSPVNRSGSPDSWADVVVGAITSQGMTH